MDFIVHPEIQALLPQLAPEEFAGLTDQIKLSKHVEPGVVGVLPDGQRILADGHNRLAIIKARKRGLILPTRDMAFPSLDALKEWVINNQLGRRNLTDKWRSYYIGKEYLLKKGTRGGDQKSEESKSQNETSIPADESVAEKHGVSAATVHRDADFAAAVDEVAKEQGPEAATAILDGKTGQTKAEVIAIETEAHKKIREYLLEHPEASNKQVHRDLDVSEHTVASVKRKMAIDGTLPPKNGSDDTPPKGGKRGKGPKNGREKYDWKALDTHFGKVNRLVDDVPKAYDGEKKSREFVEGKRLLGAFYAIWESWKKRLAKVQS